MPSLRETQDLFADALRDPARAAEACPLFRGQANLAQQRLGIYRGNVFANRGKALAGAYPVVRRIVGEEFFEAMAGAYARTHPAASGDLNDYGAQMAEFLALFPHTADLPYLPDVARMEWLAHRAYFAIDAQPQEREPDSPLAEALDTLRLRLAPGCAILSSPWPLARIWATHRDDYEGDIVVDFDSGPDTVTIFRASWKVVVQAVSPAEACLIEASVEGETLGEALEAACAVDPSLDPGATLARLAAIGITAGLETRCMSTEDPAA